MMQSSLLEIIIVLLVLIAVVIICIKTNKLTIPAALTGGVIGFLIWLGAGVGGLVLLGVFFFLGVKATSHRRALKMVPGEQHQEKRSSGQVFANGGMAAIMALLALLDTDREALYRMMMAAALASATADTLSSELGMIYGRNFYNIISFKEELKGLDGVVSLEGTLLGAAGALIIAVVYALFFGITGNVIIVFIAGNVGNLADSWLGATLERKQRIGNNTVNFLNTLLAALVAMGGWYC
ncbi:DUF92 domain-containing protein [Chitinophaga sp. 30R24]|uniref:DUF92 domain-containing protein n=1 Tax=Chitinophaga sp. 30R24 TaxID=3248838 RepID=UPI003B90422C